MTTPTAVRPRFGIRHLWRFLGRVLRWLIKRAHGVYTAFGLFLLIAMALGLGCVWLFAELANLVGRGGTQRFDDTVLGWLHSRGTPEVDRLALQITAIGNGATVMVTALIVCAFLWVFRHRLAVLLVVMAMSGAALGNGVLKGTFDRPRPEAFIIQTPFARPVSASFPSGHATGAIALYLVLAYLIGRFGGRGYFRFSVNALAAALVLAIGVSRMYLGVHYPSDVAAGYLMGFSWVTFCIIGYERLQAIRRRPLEQALATKPVEEPAT